VAPWSTPRLARVTLDEFATKWLRTRPNLRPRTRETYESQLRLHIRPATGDIELGKIELGKLTPATVREWRAQLSMRLTPNTVAKCYRLLRTILETAVADELITRNPCAIKGAGVERVAERPVATVEQVWALADATPPRYRCLILLAGFLGLRRGELLGLECRHVDLLHRTIRVEQQQIELNTGELIVSAPKTEAGVRTVALPAFLVPELESHLGRFAAPGRNGRVFTGERSDVLRKRAVDRNWARARVAVADLPDGFHFHDLRHTANTITAGTGASTAELMHRMGHASSAAALRYQHATHERDVEVPPPRQVRRATEPDPQTEFRAMDALWTPQNAPIGTHPAPVGNTFDQAVRGGPDETILEPRPAMASSPKALIRASP
jgi:integrase